MRFLPLLLANLGRKKARTALTAGSFAVALFLFGILVAVRSAFHAGVEMAGADRLVVTNRVSIIQPLPIAYRDRIARLPGVSAVTHAAWFGGVYQDERNFFPQFAVDADSYPEMYPELRIAPDQLAAFRSNRRAAVVGEKTARRFGWEVGDRIPLRGSIFTGEWAFDLVGIYGGTRPQDDTSQFWFRADYLEENGPDWFRGYVGWYVVRIGDPGQALEVARGLDALFANSAWETRTQTEQALNASFLEQMGNIEMLILSIGGVVVFTLLLVTANTMAAAVRERVPEHAVLKALGWSDGGVLALVLAEVALMAGAGAATGLALAKLWSLAGDPTGGLFPMLHVSGGALAGGLGLAVAVGLAAGLVPALAAMRLRVVEALRRA